MRRSALGDVLMCTPALRRAKELNPSLKVFLYTDNGELVKSLPFIDEVRRSDQAPKNAIHFRYEHVISPPRHIAKLFGDQIGLKIRDLRPTCIAPASYQQFDDAFWNSEPTVAINRTAGPWTPNKNWPDELWEDLIEKLLKKYRVIDIGSPASPKIKVSTNSEKYIDLRGRTSLTEMVFVLSKALAHIGPISGPVHVAAAFDTPSVVIYGGYEHPTCSEYRLNESLFTPLDCAPCWLRTPCPFDRRCLRAIGVQQVLSSLERVILRKKRLA